jgi:all-trans-retinol dehydrogenase (NAD+)
MWTKPNYYRGKNVLITGAGAGLGRLMAERIAAQAGRVVLWDINEAALASAQRDLHNAGGACATYRCDVSSPDDVKQVAERVLAEHGPVDILINNAGVVSGKLLLELTEHDIQRTFGVNSLALFWTTRAFLPAMLERGSGHVVTIASAAGLVATVRQTDYAASKHAAVGFDEALRCELHHLGQTQILTTLVCPYYVATGMFDGAKASSPFLPVAEPERVAEQIVDGISRGRRRMFLPPFVAGSYLGRVLSTSLFDASMRVLGVSKSMDEFRGH